MGGDASNGVSTLVMRLLTDRPRGVNCSGSATTPANVASVRPIESAVILAVGTELTTGSTRDTNSGELAKELTDLGVRIRQTIALPDDLSAVTAAFSAALEAADLVVSTGGLGPIHSD